MKLLEALRVRYHLGSMFNPPPTAIARIDLNPADANRHHDHLLIAQIQSNEEPFDASVVDLIIICKHSTLFQQSAVQTVAYWQTVYEDLDWQSV